MFHLFRFRRIKIPTIRTRTRECQTVVFVCAGDPEFYGGENVDFAVPFFSRIERRKGSSGLLVVCLNASFGISAQLTRIPRQRR